MDKERGRDREEMERRREDEEWKEYKTKIGEKDGIGKV